MDEPPTCGMGLAANAPLPLKMGEVMAAVARILELHLPSLDVADPAARAEREAYASLVARHREAADLLLSLGAEMASYRDLAAAPHDEAALATPENLAAFSRFVDLEQDVLAMLERRLDEDRAMLQAWAAGEQPG